MIIEPEETARFWYYPDIIAYTGYTMFCPVCQERTSRGLLLRRYIQGELKYFIRCQACRTQQYSWRLYP